MRRKGGPGQKERRIMRVEEMKLWGGWEMKIEMEMMVEVRKRDWGLGVCRGTGNRMGSHCRGFPRGNRV